MNKLPPEVKYFVKTCNIKKQDKCTLIGKPDSPPMCCTTTDFTDLYFLSILEPPPTGGYADYNKKQIELCAAMLRNDTDDAVRAVYDGLDFVSNDDDDPAVFEATPADDDADKSVSQGSLLDDNDDDCTYYTDEELTLIQREFEALSYMELIFNPSCKTKYDVIDATSDLIPIPSPNLQVQQQPLFPPPAPPPLCSFNFSYDDDVIEATPEVIPIPIPNLQVQQQPAQEQV